nr:DNA-directed RNA polymerases IV and V subunit 4-like isoform X4 [Malus domestica]
MSEKGGKGFSLPKPSLKSTPPSSKDGKDDSSTKSKKGRRVQFDSEELPKSVKCMMDCEAADILQGIQEQMVMLSKDPTIKIPVSFDKGLQYANSTSRYTHPQSGRHVLETLKKYGVKDGEVCVIANVCPETTDEVFALVPSLKTVYLYLCFKNAFPKLFGAKRSTLSQPLKDVLSELTRFKRAT